VDRRGIALLLMLSLGLFSVLEGAHVPTARLSADDAFGPVDGLHSPTHRHRLDTGVPDVRDDGHDQCPICLAHTGFHAVARDALVLHPAAHRGSSLPRLAGLRAPGFAATQPPSRAPPQR